MHNQPLEMGEASENSKGDAGPAIDDVEVDTWAETEVDLKAHWARPFTFGDAPEHKQVPGTMFAVDAFQYQSVEGAPISMYFLTHFHGDHYIGMHPGWRGRVACTTVTAQLVMRRFEVPKDAITIIDIGKTVEFQGVSVTAFDANHCPGSVMFMFYVGKAKHLHTGDFRFCQSMLNINELQNPPVHNLYLDTTYSGSKFTFPVQDKVIDQVISQCRKATEDVEGTLVVVGTYGIGKERVFLKLARELGWKAYVSPAKFQIMQCLCLGEDEQLLTTDPSCTQLHILPLQDLHFTRLSSITSYLKKQKGEFKRVFAVRPTGWSFTKSKPFTISNMSPAVTVMSIPYSEHSSGSELRQFVKGIKPKSVIPTVFQDVKEKQALIASYANLVRSPPRFSILSHLSDDSCETLKANVDHQNASCHAQACGSSADTSPRQRQKQATVAKIEHPDMLEPQTGLSESLFNIEDIDVEEQKRIWLSIQKRGSSGNSNANESPATNEHLQAGSKRAHDVGPDSNGMAAKPSPKEPKATQTLFNFFRPK